MEFHTLISVVAYLFLLHSADRLHVGCIWNPRFNPSIAGHDYISSFFSSYYYIKYQLLSIIAIKRDINQQHFNIVVLHFVKSE